ncbi:MAG: CD225/dispanin family protein [Thermodesulfobacteriota bacterium]
MVWAILTTLFCCLPFGVVSIVYAAQVSSKLTAGDLAGAQNASRQAKIWAWVSFGSGIVVLIISLLFGVLGYLMEGSGY